MRDIQPSPTVDGTDDTVTSPQAPGAPLSAWQYRLVVMRHYRAVYGYAVSTLGDPSDAEDVVQEAFVRFWQRSESVRRPREWLLTVARNLCLDRLRQSRRTMVQEPAQLPEQPESRDPEWHYSRQEIGSELDRLIAELPEPQRSLIVLYDVQGLNGAECAEILGINTNQVKVYLYRARRKLRKSLENSR